MSFLLIETIDEEGIIEGQVPVKSAPDSGRTDRFVAAKDDVESLGSWRFADDPIWKRKMVRLG